jgi:mono/diheme cytochrome c family protein
MRKLAQASILIAVLACLSSAAMAGAKKKKVWWADAGRGLKLASTLCSGCHIVSSNQNRGPVAGVPTFRAIANLPGRTDQFIANAMIQPHPPMPNTQLTQHEIADLLAYFGTLRKLEPGKPAEQKKKPGRSKPAYPSPS